MMQAIIILAGCSGIFIVVKGAAKRFFYSREELVSAMYGPKSCACQKNRGIFLMARKENKRKKSKATNNGTH